MKLFTKMSYLHKNYLQVTYVRLKHTSPAENHHQTFPRRPTTTLPKHLTSLLCCGWLHLATTTSIHLLYLADI